MHIRLDQKTLSVAPAGGRRWRPAGLVVLVFPGLGLWEGSMAGGGGGLWALMAWLRASPVRDQKRILIRRGERMGRINHWRTQTIEEREREESNRDWRSILQK